jgi:serine/threonine-protein kinase RsbW
MGRSLDLHLSATPRAPGKARRRVADLAADLPPQLRADLQLLVSELVANSLRHGSQRTGDAIDVRARVGDCSVRVEVSDPAAGFLPDEEPSGEFPAPPSGLWLVHRLANRWGVEREGGTRLWFEADLAPAAPEPQWAALLSTWPRSASVTAMELIRAYGQPDEAREGAPVWRRPDGSELVFRPRAAGGEPGA